MSSLPEDFYFMVARLTEVAVMLIVVSAKDQVVVPQKRWVAFSIAFVYSAIWILVIYYYPTPLLPDLVQEGIGTTIDKE